MGRQDVQGAPVQREVLEAIRESSEPMQPKEIVEATGRSRDSVNSALSKLKERGDLVQPGYGKYDLPNRVSEVSVEGIQANENIEDCTATYPVSRAGAGPGKTHQNESITVSKQLIRAEIGHVPDKEDAFWVQVHGESMEPWLQDGSYAFALRQKEVDVPGRYVIWWGEDEAEICCYLGQVSDSSLLLRKYGPEEEWELTHKEKDIYDTPSMGTVRMQVQGRIIWPPSTAKSVMDTVVDKMGDVMQKALNK